MISRLTPSSNTLYFSAGKTHADHDHTHCGHDHAHVALPKASSGKAVKTLSFQKLLANTVRPVKTSFNSTFTWLKELFQGFGKDMRLLLKAKN